MDKFKYQFYILTGIVSVILLLYGINMFPVPGTDSRVFIPPAVSLSEGLGFNNPLYDITFIKGLHEAGADPFQFNYYVPLFPLLLGILSKISPAVTTTFTICALFSIIGLLLYARTIVGLVTQRARTLVKVMALCSVPYIANMILPTVGRPENISCILCFVLFLLYRRRSSVNPIVYNLLVCTLFASMLSAQLISFYFSFLFFVTFEVIHSENILKTILVNVGRFAGLLLIAAFIFWLSPNGLMNTIHGINAHGSWALTRHDRSVKMFFYYWMSAPLSMGFLVIFIVAAVAYLSSIAKTLKQVKTIQVVLVVLLQLLIVVGLGKFVLYASPAVYNATQFVFPIIVYLTGSVIAGENAGLKKICGLLATLTFVAGIALFLRWLLLFIDYKTSGKDYASAKPIINEFVHTHRDVHISAGLWSLFDNPNDAHLTKATLNSGDLIIVQQVYTSNMDEYLGKCTIVYDWRTANKRKMLGIPLSNTAQGYSFVVLRVN